MRRPSIQLAGFALCMFFAHPESFAQASGELHFDLARVGLIVNGQQICEDKGRLQDYPSKTMDQIIAAGPKAIPILIGMITDARMAKTREPIICFWPGMAIGDIAFCTLSDLFTDSTYAKSTMPGARWDAMLGPADDQPAWNQLHDFIKQHGRKALQAKWQQLWDKHQDQVEWDAKERCFKLRVGSN